MEIGAGTQDPRPRNSPFPHLRFQVSCELLAHAGNDMVAVSGSVVREGLQKKGGRSHLCVGCVGLMAGLSYRSS